jgi:hypothetical protein
MKCLNAIHITNVFDKALKSVSSIIHQLHSEYGENPYFMSVTTQYITTKLLHDIQYPITSLIGKDFYPLKSSLTALEELISKITLLKPYFKENITYSSKSQLITKMHGILPPPLFHNITVRMILECVYRSLGVYTDEVMFINMITLYSFKRHMVLPNEHLYPLHNVVFEGNLIKLKHILSQQSYTNHKQHHILLRHQ